MKTNPVVGKKSTRQEKVIEALKISRGGNTMTVTDHLEVLQEINTFYTNLFEQQTTDTVIQDDFFPQKNFFAQCNKLKQTSHQASMDYQ